MNLNIKNSPNCNNNSDCINDKHNLNLLENYSEEEIKNNQANHSFGSNEKIN